MPRVRHETQLEVYKRPFQGREKQRKSPKGSNSTTERNIINQLATP